MLKPEFVRLAKSGVASKAVTDALPHELTNITVKEVSLVDRAANGRKFLVKKRAKASPEKAVPLEDDDIVDLAAMAKGDLPGADLDARDIAAAASARAAEEERERERERAIAAQVTAPAATEGTTPPAAAEETPPAPPAATPAATPAVTTPPAGTEAAAPAAASEPPKADGAEGAAPVAGSASAANGDSEAAAGAAASPEPAAPPAEGVEKVGRPMAKERLVRLRAAYKTVTDGMKALEGLLGELDASDVDVGTLMGKSVPSPAAAPAVPVAVSVPTATAVEALTSDINKQSLQISALTNTLENGRAEITKLNGVVEALQKMVKDQGDKLAKSRLPLPSNAISLEKSEFDGDKVVWHADMASPQARVKGRSF